ncbi:MAG: 50S ribosomal protein L9 [Actinobacteria bacterium]|nr:MAG: 50S ribosomal protein L9 [Actinomycetota bacterium]
MKLILTADVDPLGKRGDVVDVSDGYGRNYLLPRKKAVKASEAALEHAERVREARIEAEQRAKEEAERIATQLVGTRVVLAAQAGDEGQLYGSVSVSDVVEGIRRFAGVELEKGHVEIGKPIKAIGLHEVQVNLHPDVQFPVTIDIIPA